MVTVKDGAEFDAYNVRSGEKDGEPWQCFQIYSAKSNIKPTIFITNPIDGLREGDTVRIDKLEKVNICPSLAKKLGWVITYNFHAKCTKTADNGGKGKYYWKKPKPGEEWKFEIPEF